MLHPSGMNKCDLRSRRCLLLPLWLGAAAKRLASLQSSMSTDVNAKASRWTSGLMEWRMERSKTR